MALQINYVQPDTGAPSPKAYVRVEDATILLADDRTTVLLAIYHSKATADAGKEPVTRLPSIMLDAKDLDPPNPAFVTALAGLVQAGQISSPRDALKACLYVLLKSRQEFAGAVDV